MEAAPVLELECIEIVVNSEPVTAGDGETKARRHCPNPTEHFPVGSAGRTRNHTKRKPVPPKHVIKAKDKSCKEAQLLYNCESCSFTSNTKYKLARHRGKCPTQTSHAQGTELETQVNPTQELPGVKRSTRKRKIISHQDPESSSEEEAKVYACDSCNYQSINQSTFTRHAEKCATKVYEGFLRCPGPGCQWTTTSFTMAKLAKHWTEAHSTKDRIEVHKNEGNSKKRITHRDGGSAKPRKSAKLLSCNSCNYTTRRSFNFMRHGKGCPGTNPGKGYLRCPHPECQFMTNALAKIEWHMSSAHGTEFEVQRFHFPDQEAFHSWRREVGNEEFTKYQNKSKAHDGRSGHFYCHRSSHLAQPSKSTGKRRSRIPTKSENLCTSRIRVEEVKGGLDVVFHRTHTGHPLTPLKKMYLPRRRPQKVPKQKETERVEEVSCPSLPDDQVVEPESYMATIYKTNVAGVDLSEIQELFGSALELVHNIETGNVLRDALLNVYSVLSEKQKKLNKQSISKVKGPRI